MRYAPLIFILSYLAIALIFTIWGPITYRDFDVLGVSLYLGAICVAISVGYTMGITQPMALPRRGTRLPTGAYNKDLFKTMLWLAVVGVGFVVFDLVSSGHFSGDLSSIGDTYNQNYQDYEKNSGHYTFGFITYTLFAAPTFLATVWGIYFLRNLSMPMKALVILTVFGIPVLYTLSVGTQKNIGDIMVYTLAIFSIKRARRRIPLTLKTTIIASSIVLIGIAALTTVLSVRYSSIGIGINNINENDSVLVKYNTDHPIFHLFGATAGFAFAILTSYLTNGLNGLSYALHVPSTWTYGLGSSYSISVIANRVFGVPFPYFQTYPYLTAIETGWSESRWYSVFSWFASDFTFIGTIPLFGYFAYIYARSWLESVRFQNPYSIALFCLLSLGVVFMTANNQLVQSPGALITLTLTVILYSRFHRRYNRQLQLSSNEIAR